MLYGISSVFGLPLRFLPMIIISTGHSAESESATFRILWSVTTSFVTDIYILVRKLLQGFHPGNVISKIKKSIKTGQMNFISLYSQASIHMHNNIKGVDLTSLNTFGIASRAAYYSNVTTEDELQELFLPDKLGGDEILILGEGSNLLFVGDYKGHIIHPQIEGIHTFHDSEDYLLLEVMAGENWDNLVAQCTKQGYGGLENLSLIPGSAGASPVQNIGAYGVELEEIIEEVKGYNLLTKKKISYDNLACGFGYRTSIFKEKLKSGFIITSMILRLSKHPRLKTHYGNLKEELSGIRRITPQHVRDAVIRIRKSKLPDPSSLGNAGSFFKNPVVNQEQGNELRKRHPEIPLYKVSDSGYKIAAGWLIEQCGWKGYRKGDAGVHKSQALVLVNYGHASGRDLLDLAMQIRDSVKDRFSITLENEVRIIGGVIA